MGASQRIAIIGCGFAGLSLAYKLGQRGYSTTIFDPLGVGGMSARLPIVLSHPYPSRMCVRTQYASEALRAAHELIEVSQRAAQKKVAFFTGLDRVGAKPRVMHDDLETRGNTLFIRSGYSLHTKPYLEGLFLACKNVELVKRGVESFDELNAFEAIVLCVGATMSKLSSILDFLKLDRVKGQMLLCEKKHSLERPRMDTLHEIPMQKDLILASTYERDYRDLEPNTVEALAALKRRKQDYPFEGLRVKKCYASCRLSRKSPQYLPVCQRIEGNIFAFTALGSRGAIYHAYFAEKMANMLTKVSSI